MSKLRLRQLLKWREGQDEPINILGEAFQKGGVFHHFSHTETNWRGTVVTSTVKGLTF